MNIDITVPADSLLEEAQRLFSQPTAQEMSRLIYGVRDLRVDVEEEARDDFAHLLNRGSLLE